MIKIRWRKLDPEHVSRYTFHERAVHLIVAVTCVYLVLSGLALHTPYLFWMSSVLGGAASMRLFHPFLGLFYFAFLVYMWWMWRRDVRFNQADRGWMQRMEAYITNHDDDLPPIDRWNAGQKIFFWMMMVSGIGLVASGSVLWFPEYVHWNLQWIKFLAIILHAACALVSIGGLMIHLYMGIFLVKGGFRQIITGEVTRSWANHHHRLWFERVTKERADG
jgi:formate dehydrogenase subunit gamma